MKSLILFSILLLFVSNAAAGKKRKPYRQATGGSFLMMVPRAILTNSTSKVYLSLYGVPYAGDVSLEILKENTTRVQDKNGKDMKNRFDSVLYEEYSIAEGTSTTSLTFNIPDLKPYENYKMRVSGDFEDGYQLDGEVKVDIRTADTRIVFIQTDKPFYKPGQKVMLRVLAVDGFLKPLDSKTLAEVYIEQPNSARVAQWKNVDLSKGIQQFEMPLPDEPSMGMWTIYVVINDNKQSQSFEVKEYVLPKFEVDITIPSYTLATDMLIPITVCANYTYGKGVEGILKMNVSKQTYGWYDDEKKPIIKETLKIKGCLQYYINVTAIDEDCCRSIQINAEVTESGTDVIKTASKYITRTQNPLKMDFQTSSFDYVKPGIPYRGELKVKNPDDTPALYEPISICMTLTREREIGEWFATQKKQFCKNLTSDDQGIVKYAIPPQPADIVNIELVAKSLVYDENYVSKKLYQPSAYGNLKAWYSPSGSQVQIEKADDAFACDSNMGIKVLYTFEDYEPFKLYYQVITQNKVFKKKTVEITPKKISPQKLYNSRNSLTENGNETRLVPSPENPSPFQGKNCGELERSEYRPNIGSHSINLHITASLSPSFTIIVYYVREDREVVAASREFNVNKCLQNKVTMKFGSDKKEPGKSTSLTLTASPYSQCGVRVVDKSVIIMDPSKQLTLDDVFNRFRNLDIRQTYSLGHCGKDERQPGLPAQYSRIILPPRQPSLSSPYEDAISAFESAGFYVISDLVLLSRPCKPNTYSSPIFPVRGPVRRRKPVSSGRRVSSKSVVRNDDDDEDASGRRAAPKSSTSSVENIIRAYFPDTWLFEMQCVGKEGKLTTSQKLPDTITEWVGNTVCLDVETGLGISNTAKIQGFKPFFLSFTLPYSIIRGEKLPVIVSVFNYLKQCLPITISLTRSDDYILLSDSEEVYLCVCGEESKSYRFFVQPKYIGQLNFTVSGEVSMDSDACGYGGVSDVGVDARDALTNSILVQPEGFPYEKVTTYFFFPQDELDGEFAKLISYQLPDGLVEGSERGFFSVTGDIMGPVVQNFRNLIQLPTGCGEQNIAKFLPIVYVLDYLTATGELKKDLKDEAILYLQKGYISELRYQRSDKSYSAFGSVDEQGSMFLTAFVVRAYAEASKYITIDNNDLQNSVKWIISKQTNDGCFPVIGQTFHEEIKGGASSNATSSITAYILMSLLIADSAKNGMYNDTVYNNAVYCIESETSPTPYQNALFAYTFALANDFKRAESYFNDLYYTADESGDTTRWNYGPLTTQVQIAAYAVMSSIILGKPTKNILPIIRWMNSRRNSYGGFYSSQDTVTGLKALSKFAPLISKDVNLSVWTSGILEKKFSITNENRLLFRTEKTAQVPGKVNAESTGTGGGMIQATVRCNTVQPYQEQYFELIVTASDEAKSCEFGNINVCTRYLPKGKGSNMALLEIKMVSGVIPIKETLQKLQNNPVLNIQRFDVGDNTVIFYFKQLTNEKTCLNFAVQRIVQVQDLKPATAKVYDYYAPEYKQEAIYSLSDCN